MTKATENLCWNWENEILNTEAPILVSKKYWLAKKKKENKKRKKEKVGEETTH